MYSQSMLPMEHANRAQLQLPIPFHFMPGYDGINDRNSQLPFTQFNEFVDCFNQVSLTSNKEKEPSFALPTSVTIDDNLSMSTLCHNQMPMKKLRSKSDGNIRSRRPNSKKSFSKKTVRFADTLGMQLVTVYKLSSDCFNKDGKSESVMSNGDVTTTDDKSDVAPFNSQECKSARPSRQHEINCENLKRTFISRTIDYSTSSNAKKELRLLFDQPSMDKNFILDLEKDFVKLNKVTLKEQLQLHGEIKVRNIAFHKKVTVRYTIDSWKAYTDLSAQYISSSDNAIIDTFSFSLILPTNVFVDKLEFAIKYDCNGMSYWDNNNSSNYVVEVITSQIEDQSRLNYEGVEFYYHKMGHHFL